MSNVKPVVGLRLGVLVDMGPGSVTGGTLAAFEAVNANEFQIPEMLLREEQRSNLDVTMCAKMFWHFDAPDRLLRTARRSCK